jgi:hypothetical protein
MAALEQRQDAIPHLTLTVEAAASNRESAREAIKRHEAQHPACRNARLYV